MALAIHLREFRLAADGYRRADDGAGLSVDQREIVALAVEGQDAVSDRLVNDGIGILAGVDFARDFEGSDVEHCHVVGGAVAGEAFAEIVRDRDAVDALRIGNSADEFVADSINDFCLGAVGDVEAMIGGIAEGVIGAVGAADFNVGHYLVRGRGGEG